MSAETWSAETGFTIKDSGAREQYSGGMVRDTQQGKTLFSLVLDGPMFKRWAIHLTKGAIKYAARNWMKAEGEVELDRFKESALRHFVDWYDGKLDEDHAAGVFFNINGAEYVKLKLQPAPVVIPKLLVSADPADVLLQERPQMSAQAAKRLDVILKPVPSDEGPRAAEVPKGRQCPDCGDGIRHKEPAYGCRTGQLIR